MKQTGESATIDPIDPGVYRTVNAVINLTPHPPGQDVLDGKEELRKAFAYLKQFPGIEEQPSSLTLSEYLDEWTVTSREYTSLIDHHIRRGLGHYRLDALDRDIITACRNKEACSALSPQDTQ